MSDTAEYRLSEIDCEWFAVQVWASRERRIATDLTLRGYQVFLPCYRDRRRWSDRVKTVERALFPGYLFCASSAGTIGNVVDVADVIRVVGVGNTPLAVPTDDVETIRRIVSTRLRVEPWPFLQAGQRARIEMGPLRDIEGVIVMVRNAHRLVVSISLLQRSVAVELDSAWVSVLPHVSPARPSYARQARGRA